MPDRPNIYLDKPDALSSAITRLKLTAEIYVNGDFCGTWAVDTSGSRRIPFHLIANGSAWLHVADNAPKQLTKGDLVVFPKDSSHIVASTDDIPGDVIINSPDPNATDNPTQMICGFFEFKNQTTWPLLDSLAPVIVLDLSDTSEEFHARSLIKQIIYELDQEEPGHYAVVNQLAYLLFIQVVRQQIRTKQVKCGMLAALFDGRLSKALAAMHNSPEQNWTLDSLASQATMSRSSFSALFTETAGMSAMQYLTLWRMEQAKKMLETTEQPIWQIAEQCGYQSEAAFQKAFKKTLDKTPGQVRRLSKQLKG